MLGSALSLAEQGWQVLPLYSMENGACSCSEGTCSAPGKHPRTPHGVKDATDDEDQITTWWSRWPNANIGIATGEGSGLWVLDVDVRADAETGEVLKDGEAALRRLEAEHDPLSPTLEAASGGGRHLYFAWDGDAPPIGCSRGGLPAGLDVRGNGGYVVAPPSVHASGHQYAWERDPRRQVIALAPPWLLRLVLREDETPVPMSPVPGANQGHRDGGYTAPRTNNDGTGGLDAELVAAVGSIDSACGYEEWLTVGMALHLESGGSDAGFDLFLRWSAKAEGKRTPSGNPAYRGEEECRQKWASFSCQHPGPVRRATLIQMAHRHGFIALDIERRDPVDPLPPAGHWPDEPEYVWELRGPPPFPLDAAFPPALGKLAHAFDRLAWCYQVPVDLVALLGMPIAMAALSGKAEIKVPGERWVEPAVIWMLVATPSGCLKSPVHRDLIAPMRAWEAALDTTSQKAAHLVAIELAAAAKSAATKALSNPRASQSQRVAAQEKLRASVLELTELDASGAPSDELIAHEATTERLVEILARQKGRALVSDSEGDIFDVAMGRYSNQIPNLGPWLKGHDGDTIKQERVKGDRIVPRPLINLGVATQPEALDFLSNKVARGRGFVARLCVAVLPPTAGRQFMPGRELHDHEIKPWCDAVHRLLDVSLPPEPRRISLGGEAADLFRDWGRRHEAEADRMLRDEGEDPRDAWFRKFPGKVLRLGLLLHGLHPDGFRRTEVDAETMRAAIVWGDHLAVHNRRLDSVTRSDPDLAVAERILNWLNRKNLQGQVFTRSEVHQALKGPNTTVKKVDDVNAPLAALAERGWIRPLGESLRRSGAHRQYEARPDLNEHLERFRAREHAAKTQDSDGRPRRW